jgi:hypothetical protein
MRELKPQSTRKAPHLDYHNATTVDLSGFTLLVNLAQASPLAQLFAVINLQKTD